MKRKAIILFIFLFIILFEVLYLFGNVSTKNSFQIVKGFIANINQEQREASLKKEAQRLVDFCYPKVDRWKCYQEELKKLTERSDLFFAADTLFVAQTIDPVLKDCHVLAHFISQKETEKNPERWKELINKVDVNQCGTGYMHGIIEVAIGKNPNSKINANLVNKICSFVADDFRKISCVHLFGHLLYLEEDGSLPPALGECENIREDAPNSKFECYIGVFMEDHQKNVMVDHKLIPPPVIDEAYLNQLEESCRKYNGSKGEACWHEMGEMYTKFYQYKDPFKVYEACYKGALRQVEKDRCYTKAIVPLTLSWERNSSEDLASVCAPYGKQPGMYNMCVHYMVSTLMYYTVNYVDRAVKLCSYVEKTYQDGCFQELTTLLKKFIPQSSKRKSFCHSIPEPYTSICEAS